MLISTATSCDDDHHKALYRLSKYFVLEAVHHEFHSTVDCNVDEISLQIAKWMSESLQKVTCTMCSIEPEGFRGLHDLRRHVEENHGATREAWVCKDISPDQTFLSKCKSCRENKTYGAYYNNAAHLRRIHFHSKENSKRSNKSTKSPGEYYKIPTEILRSWMEERDVPVREDLSTSDANSAQVVNSRIMILSSDRFKDFLSGLLSPDFCQWFRWLIKISSIIYNHDGDASLVGYSLKDLWNICAYAGTKVMQELESLLSSISLAKATLPRLTAVFVVLFGTIISVGYISAVCRVEDVCVPSIQCCENTYGPAPSPTE